MPYKIKGILNVSKTLKARSRYVGTAIKFNNSSTLYKANTSGVVSIPDIGGSGIGTIVQNLPISQFGKPSSQSLNFSINGSLISFGVNPLFMVGQYFDVESTVIDVSSVGSTTVFVYINLDNGFPMYTISDTEIPETHTTMNIGVITKNSSGDVISNTLKPVSRFDIYRFSTTPQGASAPVSTGNPAQAGNISW